MIRFIASLDSVAQEKVPTGRVLGIAGIARACQLAA